MKNLLFILLLICMKASGQQKNAYLFIEPNVSLSYDSNFFRKADRFSNSFYGMESYRFSLRPDSLKKLSIYLEASPVNKTVPEKLLDSSMKAAIADLKKLKNDTFTIVQTSEVRNINGFYCYALTAFDRLNKKYATSITGMRSFDQGMCKVTITHANSRYANWNIASQLMEGVSGYSRTRIHEEEKAIRNSYSVIVDTLANSDPFYMYTKPTYTGIVRIREPLKHKVVEVVLMGDNSALVIPAIDDTQVHIYSSDPAGKTTKKGELVLLNSFGKRVMLPFSFTYTSRGNK